jgi:uncharacterized protein
VSGRGRIVAGALLVAFGVGLLVLALLAITRSDDEPAAVAPSLRALLAGATGAGEPFPQLTRTRLAVGGRCLRVVIADSGAERARGLMDRIDLGDYQGMLFVSPVASSSAFTMSGTRVPLDIAWYDADGRRSNAAEMVPCRGEIADCPLYRPGSPWRFALETLHGDLPSGDLGACA